MIGVLAAGNSLMNAQETMTEPQHDRAGTVAPPSASYIPEAEEAAAERSLVDDVRALVQDGKLYAEAELGWQKKRAGYVAQEGKGIGVYFAAAGVLAWFAGIALTVGLILALGQIITYWGSTAVVAGLLLLLAFLALRRGRAKMQHMQGVLASGEKSR